MKKTPQLPKFLAVSMVLLAMAALKATSREQHWERRHWLGLGMPKCQN